jgi:hypothetical protein
MFSIDEWKRRILIYISYGGNQIIRCATKKSILEKLGGASEQKAFEAFNELLRDELVLHVGEKYYMINFDKRDLIDKIINEESEQHDLMQPPTIDLSQYHLEFAKHSNWHYRNRRTYYFYTKISDPTYWIVLIRGISVSSYCEYIHLGTFSDFNSRKSRIWRATQEVGNQNSGGIFSRKKVEDKEPSACGNNRSASSAAFLLFIHLRLVEVVSRGKYRLTSKRPKFLNLDSFIYGDQETNTKIENTIR